MREIVFDTETTGLDPLQGHRLVEIGCIELVNRIPSGQVFHRYVNPERDMPSEAFAVHGLSVEFLQDKPKFSAICEELLAFLGDAPLVAHNASFDLGFLNAELERCKRLMLGRERLVDTLMLARRRHPGGPNSLDELCARYGIDNVAPHQARRAARCRAAGGSLCGADRRTAGLADPGRERPGARRRRALWRGRETEAAAAAAAADRRRAGCAHALSSRRLGDKAIWRDVSARHA